MIWCLLIMGIVPILGMAAGGHDALYTMVGHIAIFGTAFLTLLQTRANGAKLNAAKVALKEKDSE